MKNEKHKKKKYINGTWNEKSERESHAGKIARIQYFEIW